MAGDWIKMRSELQSHPKVVRILSATQSDKFRVIGGLHAMWAVFDTHSTDGTLFGYTPDLMDHVIGWPGFSEAMLAVDWLGFDGVQTLVLPEFDEHNSQGAKRRAEDQKRKRNERRDADNNETTTGQNADKKRTREEKRREEQDQNQESNDSSASPDGEAPESRRETIPMQAILGLYNATMTRLPKARELTPKRRTLIRSAWTASPKRRSIEFWECFFSECESNDFLNGTGPYRNGHENWRPDFDYLLKQDTVTRVFERALDRLDRDGSGANA